MLSPSVSQAKLDLNETRMGGLCPESDTFKCMPLEIVGEKSGS